MYFINTNVYLNFISAATQNLIKQQVAVQAPPLKQKHQRHLSSSLKFPLLRTRQMLVINHKQVTIKCGKQSQVN